MTSSFNAQVLDPDARASVRWLTLALSAITLGGLFALIPLLARVPIINELLPDQLFSRKLLIIHVNLALGVWFYSYLALLYHLLPTTRRSGIFNEIVFYVGVAGVVGFVLALFFPDALPILSNYVPTLDHDLFRYGLLAFWAAVALTFLHPRILPLKKVLPSYFDVPPSARPGIRVAVFAYLLAMLTLVGAIYSTPTEMLDNPELRENYFSKIVWGPGHVLQVANEAAMVSVWLILLHKALGKEVISYKTSAILFTVLLLPFFGAPAMAFTDNVAHYEMFTRLMQLGIFPAVTLIFLLCVLRTCGSVSSGLTSWKKLFAQPAFTGFATSSFLTMAGFILGAMITRETTLVPAHYHASIGAVTVAYMAMTYVLFETWGIHIPTRRLRMLATLQPLFFGMGQFIMALGLAIAGYHGQERKVYGTGQHVRSTAEYVGLWVMGIGGVLAIIGGVLFLTILIKSYRRSKTGSAESLSA